MGVCENLGSALLVLTNPEIDVRGEVGLDGTPGLRKTRGSSRGLRLRHAQQIHVVRPSQSRKAPPPAEIPMMTPIGTGALGLGLGTGDDVFLALPPSDPLHNTKTNMTIRYDKVVYVKVLTLRPCMSNSDVMRP